MMGSKHVFKRPIVFDYEHGEIRAGLIKSELKI